MLFSVVSTWIFKSKRTGSFSHNNNISVWLGTFIHRDTYRVLTRNVLQNSYVLQGISEQKLKPPGPRGALCSYLKCMIASEESLLSPMVHLMQLFRILIVLIERSHPHDVTGRVAAILKRMYRFGKSSESHAFKDDAHESAVIIPGCTYIFQRSNSAKKSCGEGRSSLYRSPKSVSCWAVIWLSSITDGTNPSSLLTLNGYHAHQVRYAYRSGRKT